MRMRRWLPLAVLLALAGVAVWWTRDSCNEPQPTTPAASTSVATAPDAKLVSETGSAPIRSDRRQVIEGVQEEPSTSPDSELAHLTVQVVGKQTRKPLADIEVGAYPLPTAGIPTSIRVDLADRVARGRTDESGTVVLAVIGGRDLSVSAWPSTGALFGTANTGIPALSPRCSRELTLEVPDGDDAHVFGRVVDAATQVAIAGARVRIAVAPEHGGRADSNSGEEVALHALTTGPDGRFEFDYPSWRAPHIRVEANGYGVRLSEPLKECVDAAHPLVIELEHAATLRAHCMDAHGHTLDALHVELGADWSDLVPESQRNRGDVRADMQDARWQSDSDSTGWVSFSGLPARTPITAYVWMGAQVLKPGGCAFELEPGEVRTVEWRLGAGCTLTGLLIDDAEQPVAATSVWLAEAQRAGAPDAWRPGRVQQTSMSDSEGKFELFGVPKGNWMLSPAPNEADVQDGRSFAAVPTRVEIGEERTKQVTLRVQRGLFVKGRVLDPDGAPVLRANVNVRDDDHRDLGFAWTDSRDGAFVTLPLPSRSVWISASSYPFVDSLPVRVQAGNEIVVLQLRRGGMIRGRVVDAVSGVGCEASVELMIEGATAGASGGHVSAGSEEDGTIECPQLLPGSYSIGASTSDGRFGIVKKVDVAVNEMHADVEVRVSCGGSLRLTYTGPAEMVWARILIDGVTVAEGSQVRKNRPLTMYAPAGASVLELSDSADHVVRKQIELKAGETRELVVTDKD